MELLNSPNLIAVVGMLAMFAVVRANLYTKANHARKQLARLKEAAYIAPRSEGRWCEHCGTRGRCSVCGSNHG